MPSLTAKTAPPDQPQRQRALDPSSSVLVQAPAGSGKTDLLTRRFLRLLTEVEDPGQIVAITFTKAAAAEMRHRILTELEAAATRKNQVPELSESSPTVKGPGTTRLEEQHPEPQEVSGHDFSRAESTLKETGALAPEENSFPQKATDSALKGTGFSPYINPPETIRALAPEGPPSDDPFSMEFLAHRALAHSQALGWNLLDQPAQLRISTIDSFCRDIALQQPLLSGLGDGLGIYDQTDELYRRAARQALEQIDTADPVLRSSIESLLLWRDNNWSEMETQLVEMLKSRDRWMHNFVLEREPDWDALRERLERPFARAIQQSLAQLSQLLDQVPNSRGEALALARFACEEPGEKSPWALAECTEIPSPPFTDGSDSALSAYAALGAFLQTQKGTWRSEKGLKTSDGFPSTPRGKSGKTRFAALIASLAAVPALDSALAAVRILPPPHYAGEDWQIVRACFTLLRNAAAQLRVVFAEAGAVDYIEVAQIALNVLRDADGQPSDAALALADGIHHILVDEFQDTSRRQHDLLSRLIAAWPEREGRSCFVVGDPMQSIYFFRDADAELFPRVREAGLEIPTAGPLLFRSVALTSNFRTAKPLVARLNEIFAAVFAENDGSGVTFAPADPARNGQLEPKQHFELHIDFAPQSSRNKAAALGEAGEPGIPQSTQIEELVALIQSHADRIQQARDAGINYRIAVLGRTRNVLTPIAQALRDAKIPFRSVDLEKLSARPEILDALALARALLNPLDRVAWLGLLRAPWCGLSLADLHALTSADSPAILARPIPELLLERLQFLSNEGRQSADRVLEALAAAPALRFAQPTTSLGAWLQQVWLSLGGAQCVDPTARVNLNLLWQCLDSLPNGEKDLLGPALDAALESLTAQPDPNTSSDCGVQLMTIHKSKGLEFEVVIVPELQAGSGKGQLKMLSWLERGLPPEDTDYAPDGSLQVTEFLVAPFQSKGSDRGSTKQWVDRVYRDRESQETRRILYVAATRARDELHLFARPACKQDKSGDWILSDPKESLLATAWPALEAEIHQRFEAWKSAIPESTAELEAAPAIIESIAASATSNLVVMPAPIHPTQLRRLPPNFRPAAAETAPSVRPFEESQGAPSIAYFAMGGKQQNSPSKPLDLERTPQVEGPASSQTGEGGGQEEFPIQAESQLYQRHQGGLASRALGTAVHSLLESLARLRKTSTWEESRAALEQLQPRIAAQIRAAGIAPTTAANLAAEAFGLALAASTDPTGNWILSPHSEDATETRWTGIVSGALRTVRVDRIFRAGLTPLSTGDESWWIVDYKTAHPDTPDPAAALPQLRAIFAPQLHAYAEVLRKLRGAGTPIRAGLYYPRMLQFDWWEV